MSSSRTSLALTEDDEEKVSFLHTSTRDPSKSPVKFALLYLPGALVLVSCVFLAAYTWLWEPHGLCKMGNERKYSKGRSEYRD